MDLIIINGYTPPSPSKFDVDYSNKNGSEEQLENGYEYIEQVRAQVPSISLTWNNLVESDAQAILESVKPATFTCSYWFGEMIEDIFRCENPKLSLKLINGNTRYYNLSLTLKG